MHTALQLAPVLAAEKSKVPFYIAGGVLVGWALFISMAVGMRRPGFPRDKAQQRLVMGVSAVLVLLAVSMAVATAGTPEKAAQAATSTTPSTSTTPTATTGTPTPSSSPAAGSSSKLAIAAEPSGQLAYSTKLLQARAGTVTITMTNMSPLEHNFTLAEGHKVIGATPTFVGGSRTLTLNLKPGRYTFYCSVPGHRQAGMEGTLTVSS